MPTTTPTQRKQRSAPSTRAKSPAPAKKSPKKRPRPATLAAANKWMTEQHDAILKLAEQNTAKLTGKPRL